MTTIVCKGIENEFLRKLEERGIQIINKKKVQLSQAQLEIVGEDFDQCCTVATAVGSLEDVKDIFDEFGAYSSESDWACIRDANTFFPSKQKRLEQTVLVVVSEAKWNQNKLFQILQVNGFMILWKRQLSCNEELVEKFGLGEGDVTKNMTVYLLEAKGAVDTLKHCLGPIAPPVENTIRTTFPKCVFYCSDADGWKRDARLTNIPIKNERTLMVVLPHVLKAGKTACLFDEVQELGFQVVARKRTKLASEAVRFIYGEKAEAEEFVSALTEGNLEAAVLEKVGAVEALSMCLGPPNKTRKAYKNTLRAKYGIDAIRCGCLSSVDAEASRKETAYFFPNLVAQSDAEGLLEEKGVPKSLQEVLMKGLKELAAASPKNPVKWFGQWLLMQSKVDKQSQ